MEIYINSQKDDHIFTQLVNNIKQFFDNWEKKIKILNKPKSNISMIMTKLPYS
jgi:hypothetical protein